MTMQKSTTVDDRVALLAELKARNEIHDAVARYSRGCDRCDREAILSAFHPGATVDYNTFRGSPEEFCDWVIPMHQSAFIQTTHLLGNHLITFAATGTRAVGELYVMVTLRFEKDGDLYDLQGLGRYFDDYELRDGLWRITARRTIADSECTVRVPTENATELVAAVGTSGTRDRTDPSYAHFGKLQQ